MPKFKKVDYSKLYPTASVEVIAVLKQSDRKMEYMEYDLKMSRMDVDQQEQTITYHPSREDSLERLMEQHHQFKEDVEPVEDTAVRNAMLEKLRSVLLGLSNTEIELVTVLYFKGLSERQAAKYLVLPQKTLHNRKVKLLVKLKKLLEN